jgi:GNAT superfamily N-acetyltransferase
MVMKINMSLSSSKELVRLFDSVMGEVIRLEPDSESKIVIAIKPPHAPASYSVVEFYVDPSQRNKGNGDKLIKKAVKIYPKDIGAQCSNDLSVRLFWNNDFRMVRWENGAFHVDTTKTLADALSVRHENSSVFLKRF